MISNQINIGPVLSLVRMKAQNEKDIKLSNIHQKQMVSFSTRTHAINFPYKIRMLVSNCNLTKISGQNSQATSIRYVISNNLFVPKYTYS